METPLSNEILEEVKAMAGMFFTPQEISIALGLDRKSFLLAVKIEDSPEYNAYHAGSLQSEMIYRQKVIQLANLGSSPAQTQVAKMIEQAKIKMNNR